MDFGFACEHRKSVNNRDVRQGLTLYYVVNIYLDKVLVGYRVPWSLPRELNKLYLLVTCEENNMNFYIAYKYSCFSFGSI